MTGPGFGAIAALTHKGAIDVRLVKRLSVRGYRSIRDAELGDIGDFAAMAGLNNSGKSNFLRALSAFFTGESEPGIPLEVDSDFYQPDIRARKRRAITVSVEFSLPEAFQFRKGLEKVRDTLASREFVVSKRWTRDSPVPEVRLNDLECQHDPLGRDDAQGVEQFLGMISFRYIANRVDPLDIIGQEHQALRDALVRRLGTQRGKDEDVFQAMSEISTKLVASLADHFRSISPHGETVELAAPKSWAEMAFSFGYTVSESVAEAKRWRGRTGKQPARATTADVVQGSGIQSLLMFETLDLIDRDYFQQFGWRQAAIWAVEEPESSLHRGLEYDVARLLREIATRRGSRLQILATTHSELVLKQSDTPFLVMKEPVSQLKQDLASVAHQVPRRDAPERAAKLGVSGWLHPLLYDQGVPLVLVEGRNDVDFLEQAVWLLEPGLVFKVQCLGDLPDQPDRTGGVEQLQKYVKEHQTVVRLRASLDRSSLARRE